MVSSGQVLQGLMGEDFVTPSEKGAMEVVAVGGSREPSEEVNAVVQARDGAARPGWELWGDGWSDPCDAVRVQPMGLAENGDGYERKKRGKVHSKELPGRVEVPQVIHSNTDKNSGRTWE